jgi:hypothetical protein
LLVDGELNSHCHILLWMCLNDEFLLDAKSCSCRGHWCHIVIPIQVIPKIMFFVQSALFHYFQYFDCVDFVLL